MTAGKLSRFWTMVIILLAATTIVASLVVWSRCSPSQPIEITATPHQDLQGQIHIGGAVTNPGLYPFTAEDTIEVLLQAAGGAIDNADLGSLSLYIPEVGEEQESQKIDINRAEAWLLEALYGIGPAKAQAIVDYREQNGPFRNINELTKVEGIGPATYERIKHLIAVVD